MVRADIVTNPLLTGFREVEMVMKSNRGFTRSFDEVYRDPCRFLDGMTGSKALAHDIAQVYSTT
jgi:DNA-directed RNA polymerase specialized sigma24 family protein